MGAEAGVRASEKKPEPVKTDRLRNTGKGVGCHRGCRKCVGVQHCKVLGFSEIEIFGKY